MRQYYVSLVVFFFFFFLSILLVDLCYVFVPDLALVWLQLDVDG